MSFHNAYFSSQTSFVASIYFSPIDGVESALNSLKIHSFNCKIILAWKKLCNMIPAFKFVNTIKMHASVFTKQGI